MTATKTSLTTADLSQVEQACEEVTLRVLRIESQIDSVLEELHELEQQQDQLVTAKSNLTREQVQMCELAEQVEQAPE